MVKIRMRQTAANPAGNLDAGKVYDLQKERAKQYVKHGYAEYIENAMKPKSKNEKEIPKKMPKHVGGGWYELPNGERVQGKEEAINAMQE